MPGPARRAIDRFLQKEIEAECRGSIREMRRMEKHRKPAADQATPATRPSDQAGGA